MIYKFAILCLAVLFICSAVILAYDNQVRLDSHQLPPIETFLMEPIELENTSIWVPADKTVPFINKSCQPKTNCSYSCVLPATVHHTKTEFCPEEVARLLAEYTAYYHEQSLPLTIFNGWQWEYSYSLYQFESVTYGLLQRGGCWEGSWEAVLTLSIGLANSQWLQVFPLDKFVDEPDGNKQKSHIEVKTFNSVRTRDGYPKKRQL
jgi:hypothetical protein